MGKYQCVCHEDVFVGNPGRPALIRINLINGLWYSIGINIVPLNYLG